MLAEYMPYDPFQGHDNVELEIFPSLKAIFLSFMWACKRFFFS